MDTKQKLEELNRESLKHLEEYLKSKGELKQDEYLKIIKANEEWETAWNKLKEALMVLEHIEI